ncbi:hypothetical protein PENTCL1PPCAC_4127, partial [Pristionchus entomophagus]
ANGEAAQVSYHPQRFRDCNRTYHRWKFLSFYSSEVMYKEIKVWRGKSTDNGSVNFNMKFAFPIAKQVPIFSYANNRHLDMDRFLPIHVEDDNLDSVAAIFAGCAIDKVSLVIDNKSLANLTKVPPFLSRVRAKHVE